MTYSLTIELKPGNEKRTEDDARVVAGGSVVGKTTNSHF